MRLKSAALLAVVALSLAGCGRDPFIHGPFLIGATPPDYYPPNCRPGDVRSHDVLNGWETCVAGAPGTVHPQSAVQADLAHLPPPPPPPRQTVQPSGSRSAW